MATHWIKISNQTISELFGWISIVIFNLSAIMSLRSKIYARQGFICSQFHSVLLPQKNCLLGYRFPPIGYEMKFHYPSHTHVSLLHSSITPHSDYVTSWIPESKSPISPGNHTNTDRRGTIMQLSAMRRIQKPANGQSQSPCHLILHF